MKIRNGFISNSSSSSFIIAKHFLNEEQEKKIIDWLRKQDDEDEDGYLSPIINKHYLCCYNVYYCSYELLKFLESIGVDKNYAFFTEG